MIPIDCTLTNLLNCSEKCLDHLLKGVEHGSFLECGEDAMSIAKDLMDSACRDISGCLGEEMRNNCRVLGILFAAIHDYCCLKRIYVENGFLQNALLVEKAWFEYCNCIERLEVVQNFMPSISKAPFFDDLATFEHLINSSFGKGVYLSPEVEIAEMSCNICDDSSESCPHINGRLYDGKICKSLVSKVEDIPKVAIVDNPRDKRNRIWPWNVMLDANGRLRFKCRLFTAWNIENVDK